MLCAESGWCRTADRVCVIVAVLRYKLLLLFLVETGDSMMWALSCGSQLANDSKNVLFNSLTVCDLDFAFELTTMQSPLFAGFCEEGGDVLLAGNLTKFAAGSKGWDGIFENLP